MGCAISGIAVKAGHDVRIHTLLHSDGHLEVRKKARIRDEGPAGTRSTPVSLAPVNGVARVEDAVFFFDAGRPDWWTEEMTRTATRELWSGWRARWDGNKLFMPRALNLSRLRSVEDADISTDGSMNLDSLLKIGPNVRLSAVWFRHRGAWVHGEKELRKAVLHCGGEVAE